MENRVWVYLSDKEFSDEQANAIASETELFLKGWNAHGQALTSSFEIFKNRFLIIKADETQFKASGCSIDKQVQLVKALEQKHQLNFFNRLLVAVELNDKLEIVHSSKIKELIEAGTLNEKSIMYNIAVSTESELKSNFRIPLKNSWLNKFLNTTTI